MNYPKAIRIARSIADLSQKELADRSGINRSYLSLIESGDRSPSVETIQSISDALGIPFHLMTLLATEQSEAKRLKEEQVIGLAKELTCLLLENPKERTDDSNQASSGKSARPRVSTRSKKNRAARAA